MRKLIYNALRTPDGTVIESLHRHDYKYHIDANGKDYVIDGGTDYTHSTVHGDEELIQVFADEPFEKVRKYAYRTGHGKPGSADYGTFRKTTLEQMTDEHLEASLDYPNVTKGGTHWQLLLEEKLYRIENEITIKDE